jgi:glycine/D-amino acid oxidase-like deaminating enzyme
MLTTRRQQAELLIVGAGICGLMTAWFAKVLRPNARVVVMDRGLVGGGATRYSAFLDGPFGRTPRIRELSRRSRELMAQLRERLRDLPIVDLPMLGVTASARESEARALIHVEVETRLLPEDGGRPIDDAPEGFRLTDQQRVLTGMTASRCTDDHLASVLARHLVRAGVGLVEGVDVTQLAADGGGVRLELADGRRWLGDVAILCLGPWLPRELPRLASQPAQGVRIKKVVSVLLQDEVPTGAPVIYLFDHDAFLMPQPERGRWLCSLRSERWDCSPQADMLHLDQEDLQLCHTVFGRFGINVDEGRLGARVFCDAYTADGEVMVRELEGLPRVAVAGAACGSGIRLAPAMAQDALSAIGWS